MTLDSGIPDSQLTHDPAMLAAIMSDPLRHSRISPPMYFGMNAGGPIVLVGPPRSGRLPS